MTREDARRRFDSLKRMTVARGCTQHEADTAMRLAVALAKKYGFDDVPAQGHWRAGFEERFARAEKRAAVRFAWEYRKCGKRNCHCVAGRHHRHGPYKYGKKRQGKKVSSVYYGR